jgi:hypothetical protein
MRETVRRLLVIALCASGVVALWIVAGRSVSAPDTAASGSPGASRSATRAASPSGSGSDRPGSPDRSPRISTPASAASLAGPADSGRNNQPPHQGSHNNAQPTAVRGLRVIRNSYQAITVRWRPARAAAGIAYYQLTLNGIPAGETAGLQLTVNWFNDDMTSHFIRVRAVDGNGSNGRSGNPLPVTRPVKPTPAPTTPPSKPSPTPTTTPSPTPSTTPSPRPNPTPPSPTATDSPSRPTRTPPAPGPPDREHR